MVTVVNEYNRETYDVSVEIFEVFVASDFGWSEEEQESNVMIK